MNGKGMRQNPLLAELLIVILFFALSSCLLLQLFAAAYQEKTSAVVDSEAVLRAEDLIERFYISGLTAEAFLTGEGWDREPDGYARTIAISGRDILFRARIERTEYARGAVEGFTLTVTDDTRAVTALNAAAYRRAGGA